MDLEGRKNNTYFDQTGKQILAGVLDLKPTDYILRDDRNR